MNRQLPALLAVALLAAAGGYFVAKQFGGETEPGPLSARQPGDLSGQPRPDFVHTGPDGRQVAATAFDGQVWLVNFWATWCEPCVEEMPMLSSVQDAYSSRGFRVVGIALDDPGRASEFAAGLGLSYPVLVGGADVVVTGRRYGNSSGMLPYSVLVDREGIVRWSKLGALDRAGLEEQVEKLLTAD